MSGALDKLESFELDGWAVVAAIPDPVLVLGADHVIRHLNPAVQQVLGYAPAELIGQSFESLLPERVRAANGRRLVDQILGADPAVRSELEGAARLPLLRRGNVEMVLEVSVARVSARGEILVCLRRLSETLAADLGADRVLGLKETPISQHATYRLVFENAPLGILHFDNLGVITACNDYFIRIIGSSRHALIGLDMRTLPDRGITDSLNAALGGRRAYYEGEYRAVTSGKLTPVRVDFTPIRGEHGRVVGGVGIIEDVSERHAAERALRRSEAAFRTLIESVPDGIAVYRDAAFLYVNPALVSLLGYGSADQLIQRAVSDVVHPADRGSSEHATRVKLDGPGAGPNPEKRLVRQDGGAVVAEITTLPVDFHGEPATLMHVRDVSERREMQARLAQADRMASVGTLAAGVAHEINNPLAYVLGSLDVCNRQLDLLRAANVPDDLAEAVVTMAECVSNARQGADRVRVIVRDLMTFSRARAEQVSPVDVESVLDSTLSLAWNEIRHRARLIKRYAGVPLVLGDEARLGQVFLNLIVNAAQSIPESSADESEIHLVTSLEGDRVRVDVEDTGVGIAAEDVRRIFEPFYTTKTMGGGTGLGLAICHGIVRTLGGEIMVNSDPGSGSRF